MRIRYGLEDTAGKHGIERQEKVKVETVNGQFIMKGCGHDYHDRLRSIDDLYEAVGRFGFLPLFANSIPGFSVEERVTAGQWWTGDAGTDPWEWRIIGSRHPDIVYGKFFDSKAGFISKGWFPAFANYRRNGYDFEALFEDELASYRAKKIMDALGLDDEGKSAEVMSNELKTLAGFGKRADGSAGEKNFEGILTGLQMQSYVVMSDFRQRKNKKGQSYGWHIAMISTPETKWGYDYVTSSYSEEPAQSWQRIVSQVRDCVPGVKDAAIHKVLGIKHSGSSTGTGSGGRTDGTGSIGGQIRKNLRPQELPWPENIITEIGIRRIFGTDEYVPLNMDQMEGLRYAMSTFMAYERDALKHRYEEHWTLGECGKESGVSRERIRQILERAINRLQHPSKTMYIREGYHACSERIEKERTQAQAERTAMLDEQKMKQLEGIHIADVGFTTRSYNCTRRAGLETMADVARKVYEGNNIIRDGWDVKVTGLFGIHNLGKKTALEIIDKLDEYGVDGSWAKSEYGLEKM